MNKILLIGAGGHTRSCIDVIEAENKFEIAGLVEKDKTVSNATLGYPIIGHDNDLEDLRRKYSYALITLGQIKSSEVRFKLYKILKMMEFILPSIISPKAYISRYAKIREGSILMHNVVVNTNAEVGRNSIINNNALVEHDALIGNHCHISTGAIINGGVKIGDHCFIGSGVITKQDISIAEHSIIGAGVTLKKNINSNEIIKE